LRAISIPLALAAVWLLEIALGTQLLRSGAGTQDVEVPDGLPVSAELPSPPPPEVSDWSVAPLFAEHRRSGPPVSAVAAPMEILSPPPEPIPSPVQPTVPPDMKLVGTIAAANARLALVSLPSQQSPQVLREGEKLDAWAVTRIDGTEFELRTDDATAKFGFSQEQAAKERLARKGLQDTSMTPAMAGGAALAPMGPESLPPPPGTSQSVNDPGAP